MEALEPKTIQAKAQEMALEMQEWQAEALSFYAHLLLKWNKTYNLTSIEKEEDVLTLHILDSLSLVKELPFEGKTLLDVGSGGGLPAIPMAIMRPDLKVTMVDAVKKKILFLRQVILELRLKNAEACHTRVEDLGKGDFDWVTSRAFSSLKDFVELTQQWIKPSGRWYAMKGQRPDDEILELPPHIAVEFIKPLYVPNLNLKRHLVSLRTNQ